MNRIKREIEDIERFEHILEVVCERGFEHLVSKTKLIKHVPVAKRFNNPEPTPQRFREIIEELGPIFIKFGQMMAERKDLIPERYTQELKKLENNVPPFDAEKSREIVDEDVGLENFKNFSEEPIASASIAQVHEAELENGQKVAVKVRRPEIGNLIQKDLDIIKFFAKKYGQHKKSNHNQLERDIEEFNRWTREEIDFNNEAKNARRLRENLSDEKRIRIPKVYRDLTTSRVLTTELIEAYRVDNREEIESIDIEFEEIARIGVRSQLKQILRDGFFHADPHPSNFLVDKEGNLVYLDFGIMGKFTPKKCRLLTLMFYYTIEQDVEGLQSVLEELGYKEEDYDPEKLKQQIERIVLDLKSSTLADESFSKSFAEISLKAGNQGLYIPNDLIVMGKGIATMEGIGIDVYPEYSFEEENFQDIKNIMKEQFDPKDAAKELGVDILRNRENITKMVSKTVESQSGSEQNITVETTGSDSKVLPAALIIGSTLMFYRVLPEEYMIPVGVLELLAAVHFLD